MTKFDTIKIGDSAHLRHTITAEDVERFVSLTGDDNSLHVNKQYAEKTPFKEPVVHGMLGASFISTLIGTKLPGDGALWFGQSLDFILPVRIGDALLVKGEVIEKTEQTQCIKLGIEVSNQNRQAVIKGTVSVKIAEVEEEKESVSHISSELKEIVLVVGATGGIGEATALQLAEDGMDVAIHYYRNKKKAEELREELHKRGARAHCFHADIQNPTEIEEMLRDVSSRLGPISVLVNCAASRFADAPFESLEWSDVEEQINSNVRACFYLSQAVVPSMKERRHGKIIFLTTQALETPNKGWLAYITAKAGLKGFASTLASELAPYGVCLNLVSPGMTDTEFISNIPEKLRLIAAASTPLRRIAKPTDVAGAISYLASSKADFLVGETVRVNGGKVIL